MLESLFCLIDAETEQGVALAISRRVIDFRKKPWPHIFESSKWSSVANAGARPKKCLTTHIADSGNPSLHIEVSRRNLYSNCIFKGWAEQRSFVCSPSHLVCFCPRFGFNKRWVKKTLLWPP